MEIESQERIMWFYFAHLFDEKTLQTNFSKAENCSLGKLIFELLQNTFYHYYAGQPTD